MKLLRVAILTTDKREHDCDYTNPVPGFGTAPEALLQGFAQCPSVEVHVVSCMQRPMKSPAKLADNIWYHALHVPKIGWLRTGYQGCIRATRRKLREIGPDLVHGQGTERDCSLSAVFSGYPNVITIHGNMRSVARNLKAFPGSYLWLMALLENFTLPRTGGVFCNSGYTESLVRAAARWTWLVPNALRASFFEAIPDHAPNRQPHLVNVGSICSYKRQIEILAVLKRLHERGYPCRIEFVGGVRPADAYGKEFLRAMSQPGVEAYAIYSGLKEKDALIATLDQADGSVHFSSEEAFGLVVAEALARNLKFFGARVGGISDIASGAEGAELFDAGDWNGLEQALARWMEAGCPRPMQAAETMKQRYYPRMIAQRHVEIYREVLANR